VIGNTVSGFINVGLGLEIGLGLGYTVVLVYKVGVMISVRESVL